MFWLSRKRLVVLVLQSYQPLVVLAEGLAYQLIPFFEKAGEVEIRATTGEAPHLGHALSHPSDVCFVARDEQADLLWDTGTFACLLAGADRRYELAPANVHDLHMAEELLLEGGGAKGWALGERNYWSPRPTERLKAEGLDLLAPYRSKKREKGFWPRFVVRKRRRIEMVIGQLVERYRAKKMWTRDRWHLTSR